VAAAMRVAVGMAVVASPGWRKRPQATITKVLHDRIQRVEVIAILPVLARLAPGLAGVTAECEVFGNLVAHDCLGRGERAGDGVSGTWKLDYDAGVGYRSIEAIKG